MFYRHYILQHSSLYVLHTDSNSESVSTDRVAAGSSAAHARKGSARERRSRSRQTRQRQQVAQTGGDTSLDNSAAGVVSLLQRIHSEQTWLAEEREEGYEEEGEREGRIEAAEGQATTEHSGEPTCSGGEEGAGDLNQ